MQVVGPLCLLSVVAAGNSLCMPVEPPGGNMQDPHSLVDNLAGAGHCLSQDAAEIEDGLIQPVENEHLAPEPAAPSVDLHQDLIVRDVIEAIDIQENTEIAIDVLEGILFEFCPLPAPPGGHERIILHGSGIDDLVFSPPFFLSGNAQEFLIVLAQKADINVVIPGDHTVMAHCPDRGSPASEIRKAVFGAELIKIPEYLQFDLLQPVQCFLIIFLIEHMQLLFLLCLYP